MDSAAIEVSGISFSYGDTRAVDDVSFRVERGQILGFLGPNGAGKSTTIKILTGQLDAQSGDVRILGMPMPSAREAIHARLGVCFEEKNLYTSMTAKENLAFFAKLFGITDFDPSVPLARVGLEARAGDRVADYSKGMKQRLMMARALVNSPDVLLLDEPTDGLDPVSAIAIRNLIQAEADRGAAVLLTTHDMHEADTLSNRVAFINQGRILALDTPSSLKLRYGQRSVRIQSQGPDGVVEQVIPLDEDGSGDRVREAVSSTDVLTIHTEEATLEDIFVQFAGRGLEG
jgi:ABC-type multidrug transport system ATPase subunit